MGQAINLALTFVMCLNVFLWLGQLSMDNMNPGGTTQTFKCIGTGIAGTGNCATYQLNNATTQLNNIPSADSTVFGTVSNFFVDIFNSIKNWFLSLPGINQLVSMITAPYNILTAMHLPTSYTFAIGSLWYGLTFFLIIAFWWGRE